MEDETSEGRKSNDPTRRSTWEIKKSLLERAFAGTSTRSQSQLIKEIQERVNRSNDMPAEHREILNEIIPGQHPAILRLNALQRLKGLPERFVEESSLPGMVGPGSPSLQ